VQKPACCVASLVRQKHSAAAKQQAKHRQVTDKSDSQKLKACSAAGPGALRWASEGGHWVELLLRPPPHLHDNKNMYTITLGAGVNDRRLAACAACLVVMLGLVSCKLYSTHVEMHSICACSYKQ